MLMAEWGGSDEPWNPYLVADPETLLELVSSSAPTKFLFESPPRGQHPRGPALRSSQPAARYLPAMAPRLQPRLGLAGPEPLRLGVGEERYWVPEPRLVTRVVQVSAAGRLIGDAELRWSDGVLDLPGARTQLDAQGRATLTLPAGRYEFQVGERSRALQFLPAAGGGVLRIGLNP